MEGAPSTPEGSVHRPIDRTEAEEVFHEVANAEGESEERVKSTPSRKGRLRGRCTSSLDQKELEEHVVAMEGGKDPPLSPKQWMKSVARRSRKRSESADARGSTEEEENTKADALPMRAGDEDVESSPTATKCKSSDMRRVQSSVSRAGEADSDRELSTWEREGNKVKIVGNGYYDLLERDVKKPVNEAFAYLFEDTAESCFFRKWHRARGTANLNVFPWKELRDSRMRSVSYRAFGKDPILRNGFEIVEEWYVRNVEGIGCIVDVDISTPFLPYGKNYMVRESFCLMSLNEEETHVKVASTVIFLKSTMSFIQGKILKNAKMGSTRSSQKLADTLDEEDQLEQTKPNASARDLPESLPEVDLEKLERILGVWTVKQEPSPVLLVSVWLSLTVGMFFCLLKTQLDGMGSLVSTIQADLSFGRAFGMHLLRSSLRVITRPDLPDSFDEFVWSLIPAFMLVKLWDKVTSFSLSAAPEVSLKLEVVSMPDDVASMKGEEVSTQPEPGRRKRGKRTAKFMAQNMRNFEKLQEALLGGANKDGMPEDLYTNEMTSRLESEPNEDIHKLGGEMSSSAISKDNNEGPVIEEMFENERLQPFVGWGSKYPGHLLPTDRKKWSDRSGKVSSMTFGKVAPALPRGWKWVSEWTVDRNRLEEKCVDSAGFSYGVDFWQLKYPPLPGSGHNGYSSFVRRRRWIRIRKKIDEGSQ